MIDLKGIKNVVFDFGNVILDIDFNLTVQKFKKIGFQNIEEFLRDHRSIGFFSDYQEGKISDQIFLNKIRESAGVELTNYEIIEAWNSMLLNYSTERLNKLQALKLQYRIFILSNTNNLHYQNFAYRVPIGNCIDDLFEKAFYSHHLGLSKPSIEIYKYVITDASINPGETIFFDDLQENIDGALKAGLRAQIITHPNEWLSWFND